MKQINLKKYSFMYESLNSCGVSIILKDYLDFPEDTIIPISLSHGVDMGHCYEPLDINQVEPIHWAYNDDIYERSKSIKESIRIPHPWAIITENKNLKQGSGELIVGPPPGQINDTNLWNLIKNNVKDGTSILLKVKGDEKTKRSIEFWQTKGISVVSAGEQDEFFYHRLFRILNDFEYIISPTVSSVVFFASSINKKVKFIDDYSYYAIDVVDYLEYVNINSNYTTGLISSFILSDDTERSSKARELLGYNYLNERASIKLKLSLCIEKLAIPVFSREAKLVVLFKILICIVTKNNKFMRRGTFVEAYKYLKRRLSGHRFIIKQVSELKLWTTGRDINNFKYVELDKHLLKKYKSSKVGEGL